MYFQMKKINIICLNKSAVEIKLFCEKHRKSHKMEKIFGQNFYTKERLQEEIYSFDLHDPLCEFRMYGQYFTFQCRHVYESLSLREEFDIYTLTAFTTKDWQKYSSILNFCSVFSTFCVFEK